MKFWKFSERLSKWMGSPKTFLTAITLVVLWAASGPWFHYNDAWQLVINTSTTIITFLMVFLIQNTQNRDTDIMHIKIDELLRVTKDAQNAVLSLDNLDQKELAALRKRYKALGADEVNDPDSTPGDSSNQNTAN
ncbi:low affinity iron permease family protein [Pseudomonas sp. v388]|uniref:low affinity iron permease family protein n=1 Tax=Pseudomonas sp. v388 TaxID=2479849 RepID=UPI000F7AA2F9|nr:low affinity iron permease family protein [Pseudomonas sp. v388]RRV10558.1 low affinity iron permease family protein [Pseudomonas sp. v388]